MYSNLVTHSNIRPQEMCKEAYGAYKKMSLLTQPAGGGAPNAAENASTTQRRRPSVWGSQVAASKHNGVSERIR